MFLCYVCLDMLEFLVVCALATTSKHSITKHLLNNDRRNLLPICMWGYVSNGEVSGVIMVFAVVDVVIVVVVVIVLCFCC